MASDPPADQPKTSGRWRRILKRVLAGFLLLLLLLLAIHRPILRWGLNTLAPRLATKAGYELQWKVRGSIVSNIHVQHMKLRGSEKTALRKVDVGELKAEYSLWALLTKGTGKFLRSLDAYDVTIDADIRDVEPKPKPERKRPPEFWVDHLDVRNFNLHVATPTGDSVLRGFWIYLDAGKEGEVKAEELTFPSAKLALTDVHGRTTVRERRITLEDLVVSADLRINKLEVGLGNLADAALPFNVELRSGNGTLKARGQVERLDTPVPWLDVEAEAENVSEGELRPWVKMPEGTAWHVEKAALKLKGPTGEPRKLDADLTVAATGVRAAGFVADRLEAQALIKNGELRLPSLSVFAADNGVAIMGMTTLPETWKGMKQISGKVEWRVDAPHLEKFFEGEPKASGALRGAGTIAMNEGLVESAQGTLNGTQVRFQKWVLQSIAVDMTTDAQRVQVKSLALRLDDKNAMTASGQIELGGRQAADFICDFNVGDPAAVAVMAGLKNTGAMKAEKLAGSGKVQFAMADLREKNYRSVTAQGSATIAGFVWQDRRLQSAVAEFAMKEMRAEVSKLDVVFDADNQAHLSGNMVLDGRQPANVTWDIDLQNIAGMGAWLAKGDAPRPEAGTFTSRGTASVNVAALREKVYASLTATGTATINGLLWQGRKLETAALEFEAGNMRADVKKLDVVIDSANQAHVTGTMQLDGRQAASVNWDIDLRDLESMGAWIAKPGAPKPEAGTFTSRGTANGNVADLREQIFTGLTAGGIATVNGLRWQGRKLESAELEFGAKNGRADISKFDIVIDPQNQAHLTATAQLDGRQPADVKWTIDLQNVASVAAWVGLNKPNVPKLEAGTVVGSGTAHGSIADLREGRYENLTADGTINLDGLASGKARFEHAGIEFVAREGEVDLKRFEARIDTRNRLNARGHAKLAKPGDFTLNVDGTLPELAKLSTWVEMFKGPPLKGGSATLAWSGSGKIFNGEVKGNGTVQLTDVKLADKPAFSVALETKHEGKRAEITKFQASSGNYRAEGRASLTESELDISKLTVSAGDVTVMNGEMKIPLAMGDEPRPKLPLSATLPINISVHARKMELAKLFASIGMKAPPVTGVADADIEIQGPLRDLQGKVMVTLTNVRPDATKGKLEPATLRLNGTLANDQFSGRLEVDQKPLRTLTVTASLPFDAEKVVAEPKSLMDSEIDARVVLPDSDLSIVKRFVPTIEELDGRLGADVRITGSLRAPHWEGVAQAQAERMTFEKTPMDIKDLNARISFEDKQIKVDDISVMLAGGELRVTGGIDVTELKKPVVDLRLDARQALVVRNEQYSARADGTITAKGGIDDAVISGRAELVRGRVFKEIEFLPLSLPGERLPPPPPAVKVRNAPSLPAPMSGWTFDVDIVTRDPIRLLGNVMSGSATVDLKFTGTGAAPTLDGVVDFEGVRVRLPNSRLTVSRGRVIFDKNQPFEPEIDVRADSLVSNYEVTVNAYGSAFKPQVRFTSSPPLAENEVAMLLASGSTSGGEGAIVGAAANTAAFEVLKKAYRSVFDKAAPKRYNDDPPRLTFSVSPLTQGVTASYQISDRMQLTGETTERGTFRGMLYYMVRMR